MMKYGEHGEYDTLEEVFEMTKSLYDPEVARKRTIEIAANSIQEGIPIETISKITGLSVAELKQLQNEMRKPNISNK